MSSDAHAWALQYSPFKGANFTIHCMIADTVNDMHGNEFWMSTERLAVKCRVERKTVTRAMTALLVEGYLTLLDARKGGTNLYRFEFPESPTVWDPRQRLEVRSDGRRTRQAKVGQDVSPPEEPRWDIDAPKVGHPVPLGGTPCPTNKKEHNSTQEELIHVHVPSLEEQFDLWWTPYPRKLQRGKAFDAFKARLNQRVSFEDLLQSRDHYIKANEHTEQEYVLYPATFLNKHNWKEWLNGPPEGFVRKKNPKPLLSQPLPKHSEKPTAIDAKDFFRKRDPE